ncbi:MAG: GDYXXLXY domain-containing protein [Betaproteobacteria bacterium]
MTPDRLDTVIGAAIAEGVLPLDATRVARESRPWPVVLLIALGAWLATVPLLIAVGLMLGNVITRGVGPYLVGVLLLAAAIVVFRAAALPVFVEQLAVPALLVGGGALAFGLYRDLPVQMASVVLAMICIGIAFIVERAWLRALLGVAAAGLTVVACVSNRALNLERDAMSQFWLALHVTLALWLAATWLQRNVLDAAANVEAASAVESFSAGWLVATLAGLAWWSGMTFLAGASLEGNLARDIAREFGGRQHAGSALDFVRQGSSVLFAAAGLWWGARRWPSLRRPWCAGATAVLLMLAWFMPALGAVVLALLICATAQRWLQAGAAAVAAAWIIGAFYYQLRYPLGDKALLLAIAGIALAALAWSALRSRQRGVASGQEPEQSFTSPIALRRAGGIALTLLLTLAAANIGIWQKEDLIAHGQPVYVQLAPVDPRSLMQGDFMQLEFRLPGEAQDAPDQPFAFGRPQVVARRDARGVAVPVRVLTAGAPLAADEMQIELTPKNGRWILVTDAWHFAEGDAERWSKARYGEFRVAPDGRALLVGMADQNLLPIRR